MMPVIAWNLIRSIGHLATGSLALADACVAGITADAGRLQPQRRTSAIVPRSTAIAVRAAAEWRIECAETAGIGRDPGHAGVGERQRPGRQVADRADQVPGDDRHHHVQLEVARGPANATAASCPITWAQIWQTTSGMTGLTLPGMIDDRAAGQGCGSRPARSAGPIPSAAGRCRSCRG